MICVNCKINKIGPEIKPFGGYLCSNEHLQCHECHTFAKGLCAICKATTKFLQLQFHPANSSSELQASVTRREKFINSAFNKQLFEEIEIQSRISEESLSMKDSGECIAQNTENSDHEVVPGVGEEIEKSSTQNSTCMKTLFMKNIIAEDNNSTVVLEDHHAEAVENNNKPSNASKVYKNIRKENIFSYEGDFNDSKTMETYGIRFMDSNESVQEFLAISKHQTPTTAFFSNVKQQKSLSAKALRDFDSHNSRDSREAVHNYLESCSSAKFHQPLAYTFQHPNCNLVTLPRKQKLETTMRTVSVSTESSPSLESTYSEASEENIAAELKPHDYFIMEAIGVSNPAQNTRMISDKSKDKSNINLQQKLLETFREDAKITKLVPTEIKAKHQEKQQTEKRNPKREDKTSDLTEQLSNTYRAYYNVPKALVAPVNNLYLLPQPQPAQQEPPLPQFQTVPCSKALAQELLKKTNFSRTTPVPACLLNITRSPIKCPESTCQRMIFVSDFCKHLVVDHINLTMERIFPFQCKNFFLDARLFHCGSSKCHLLYLMCNKLSDLGSSEYKDFLPILVMTTRISINQICDRKSPTSKLDYFLVWVTGIAAEELSVSVSLSVWSRTGRVPSCHVVYSGQMYSIRNSQNAIDVWQSGRMLLLSSQQINALTDNGKEMLNLQLSVH